MIKSKCEIIFSHLHSYLVHLGILVMSGLAAGENVLLDVGLLSAEDLLVRLLEKTNAELDVVDEHVALAAGEILTDDNTEHLEVLGVRGHGVGGDDPATAAEGAGEGELVVAAVLVISEAEGDKRETLAQRLRHDDEALRLERAG